jgi:MraZ protein
MFLGQYRHNLDSKDRLTVPARYRELLDNGAYVMQGFDRNLVVMTDPAFELVAQRVNQMSITDPVARLLRRLIFSTASRLDLDKAGRALIPQFLRDTAQIQSEVVIVGSGDYFEIWSASYWEAQQSAIEDSDANAQRFAALDISISGLAAQSLSTGSRNNPQTNPGQVSGFSPTSN